MHKMAKKVKMLADARGIQLGKKSLFEKATNESLELGCALNPPSGAFLSYLAKYTDDHSYQPIRSYAHAKVFCRGMVLFNRCFSFSLKKVRNNCDL